MCESCYLELKGFQIIFQFDLKFWTCEGISNEDTFDWINHFLIRWMMLIVQRVRLQKLMIPSWWNFICMMKHSSMLSSQWCDVESSMFRARAFVHSVASWLQTRKYSLRRHRNIINMCWGVRVWRKNDSSLFFKKHLKIG